MIYFLIDFLNTILTRACQRISNTNRQHIWYILGIIVISCIHMDTLTKILASINLVICVSLYMNIFMGVDISNIKPRSKQILRWKKVVSSVCKLNKSIRIWDLFHWIFLPRIKIDYNIILHYLLFYPQKTQMTLLYKSYNSRFILTWTQLCLYHFNQMLNKRLLHRI